MGATTGSQRDGLLMAYTVFVGAQVTPLDVVKCNMQIDPHKYPSISKGFGITISEQGYSGLIRGWFPTLIGYSIQGAGKFGLYEYFKKCAQFLHPLSFRSLRTSNDADAHHWPNAYCIREVWPLL